MNDDAVEAMSLPGGALDDPRLIAVQRGHRFDCVGCRLDQAQLEREQERERARDSAGPAGA